MGGHNQAPGQPWTSPSMGTAGQPWGSSWEGTPGSWPSLYPPVSPRPVPAGPSWSWFQCLLKVPWCGASGGRLSVRLVANEPGRAPGRPSSVTVQLGQAFRCTPRGTPVCAPAPGVRGLTPPVWLPEGPCSQKPIWLCDSGQPLNLSEPPCPGLCMGPLTAPASKLSHEEEIRVHIQPQSSPDAQAGE